MFFLPAPQLSSVSYMRFSSPSFSSIRENSSLSSDALVTGVMEAAVLDIIASENSDGHEQIVVECSDVTP